VILTLLVFPGWSYVRNSSPVSPTNIRLDIVYFLDTKQPILLSVIPKMTVIETVALIT